jgi:hypothetical protein
MKCPKYDPDSYGCMTPWIMGGCPHPEGNCKDGWLPFWTDAERAGLKIMGRALIDPRNSEELWPDAFIGIRGTIRAYVKAARAVKEGK